jgi:hypothetical protein
LINNELEKRRKQEVVAQLAVLYWHVWWDCGKPRKPQAGCIDTKQRVSSGSCCYETGVLPLDCDSQRCEIREVNNSIVFFGAVYFKKYPGNEQVLQPEFYIWMDVN